jgi:uncharacterized protein YfaS (alpha-2-macroglobulin family)
LIATPGLPRVLAPGDRAEASLWLMNDTDAAVTADWKLTLEGPLSLGTTEGKVPLAAHAETYVRIPITVEEKAGLAKVAFRAAAGDSVYEETVELPVRPAAARETRLVSGRLEAGQSMEFKPGADWLKGTGDSRLCAGGLPVLEWQGGYEYLLQYPYGCLEQTLSVSFPLLRAPDLFESMLPGSLKPGDVQRYVKAGLYRVLSMQLQDGSFSWWPGGDQAYDYGSRYAIEFLLEARRAGYEVPAEPLSRALAWLERDLDGKVENKRQDQQPDPDEKQTLRLQAYAAEMLARGGKAREDWHARLWELRNSFDLPGKVRLARLFVAAGQRDKAAELLKPLEGTFTPLPPPKGFDRTLASATGQTALLLRTWLDINPKHADVAALAQRLLQERKSGRWATTHDNAQSLLALGEYAARTAGEAKTFKATYTDGQGRARTFTDRERLDLRAAGAGRLANEGPGPLYYTMIEDGIPVKATAPEEDRGLKVRRRLLGMNGQEVNAAEIREGTLLVMEVELDPLGEIQDQIVVECLLPAGLEIENPALATSGQTPWINKNSGLPLLHQEIRDDRLVLFTGTVHARGLHHIGVRAVTPGSFVLPAIAAEAMYDPSRVSRHGAGRFDVKGNHQP